MPNANTKRKPAKITISARMARTTKDKIDKAAAKLRITKSQVIEKAVLQYFSKAA